MNQSKPMPEEIISFSAGASIPKDRSLNGDPVEQPWNTVIDPNELISVDSAQNIPNQFDIYGFHKERFRNPKVHAQLRKESARWLIAMGVSFDRDKMIDPERLPS
jgi:hypothetical protein